MKKVDLTKLDIAIKYVERIADGHNPVNNMPLENDDVLNNPNIIRCMHFIKKEEGYLLDELNPETGKIRKVPSVKGKELGIYIVEREYNGRTYESVTYNQNAQEYVVRLIRELLEEQ